MRGEEREKGEGRERERTERGEREGVIQHVNFLANPSTYSSKYEFCLLLVFFSQKQ